ncbi:Uncharacterised protein [Bordetella pertussis]|nr:Uncharacterised protein [Bordetella pertussis]
MPGAARRPARAPGSAGKAFGRRAPRRARRPRTGAGRRWQRQSAGDQQPAGPEPDAGRGRQGDRRRPDVRPGVEHGVPERHGRYDQQHAEREPADGVVEREPQRHLGEPDARGRQCPHRKRRGRHGPGRRTL